MLKLNALLAIATAAAILAFAGTAQAQVRHLPGMTDGGIFMQANPFSCSTDEGYGRRGSCNTGGL